MPKGMPKWMQPQKQKTSMLSKLRLGVNKIITGNKFSKIFGGDKKKLKKIKYQKK